MEFPQTPARARLEWILAGLEGESGWGAAADQALSDAFLVSAERFVEVVAERAERLRPITLIGVDVAELSGTARLRAGDGELYVLHCTVQADEPHRITNTWMTAWVPTFCTARLPMEFTAGGRPDGSSPRLIVFSGVPGTGKSTLAEAVGARLAVPVFAADWLLGALTPFGGYHHDDQLARAEELMTTLAYRQLMAGQSAILDAPGESVETRSRWRSLAEAYGAALSVIVCVCTDPALHRSRVEGRERVIPGWHRAGVWSDVERRLATFPPWGGEPLVIDAVAPVADNAERVLAHLQR